MLDELKKEVYKANMLLKESGLVILTWGNASAIDRETGLIVIKPSGVEYDELSPNNLVVINMNGDVVEGDLKPSSDTKTHIELYKHFNSIGGIVHTHSHYATSWAQAGKEIPPFGTTHADTFYGNIPCTRPMSYEEIEGSYEKETGRVIVELFRNNNIDENNMGAVLVKSHGPFTWGQSVAEAVENAIILEETAKMAFNTELLNHNQEPIESVLLNKHFFRKHGKDAYYGQY
ncbi:MAG: L-ribulose-5-phosphate 4-epimerase [Clostridiales bacterium]|jgi:L-ribulose-5-phosphate 4-epimerase|nr:L-ribulose-5-phosphate 4-epimerase [Clostridiales bacterium]